MTAAGQQKNELKSLRRSCEFDCCDFGRTPSEKKTLIRLADLADV
jgi:hypothetical protein